MNLSLTDRPLKIILLYHIQSLREQLIAAGMNEGLDHEKTLHLSRRLDEFIYLYQSYENHQ
ncbi:Spo0E family sporulation regulatory protein-aspartic acid phosphatase [Niallia sp. Krafla_26]|uniref:Spo0E family sporulation regulatory protein-aspartic acid phosphatase n=1 Tax=Niallia sp. Krafla_26 TaxID=3064703 RepID=UPI003D17D900